MYVEQIQTQGITTDIIFQNAVTANGNGTGISVGANRILRVSIYGTNVTTSTITFMMTNESGAPEPITGIKLNGLLPLNSTTSLGETYVFDVTGVLTVNMVLSNLTGTGASVTVKGRLVS